MQNKVIFIILIIHFFHLWVNNAVALDCSATTGRVCVDSEPRMIQGFRVAKCWRYEQKFSCLEKEENNCASFESNRGCDELDVKCISKAESGTCKDFEKKFKCGTKYHENREIKLVGSEYKVIRDEKDLQHCSKNEVDKYCQILEEKCIEGTETRNIKGKDVYKVCWKWDRKYVCHTDTKIDECRELEQNKDCKVVETTCLHQGKDRCEHEEIKYDCLNKFTRHEDCKKTKFCIGNLCKKQERNKNKNLGKAISGLSMLANLKGDMENCGCDERKDSDCRNKSFNSDECRLFKGLNQICRKHTSQFNCCTDKGLIRKISACNKAEQDLAIKKDAGVCHYIGSWRGKRLNFFKSWKSYCCFNSKFARILQVQGRQQLGIGWGDKKDPDCRPLSLTEINSLDLSKIDFSEMYEELHSKANASFNKNKEAFKNRIENLKSNPSELAGSVQSKIRRFYEKK